jgi:uncharacterized protein YutE (UPF0331/DUF86 family)
MHNLAKQSPILRHALESFEHGIFHHLDGTQIGRKFALLHVDHAIELILKEKVLRIGQSIYKKDGKTITIYEAYTILEGNKILIPEKPRLEELHDLRNVVQHKGLTPDEDTTSYYINEAYLFVKRFLNEELKVNLEEYLPSKYIHLLEGTEEQSTKMIIKQFTEAETLFGIGTYGSAVISAFVALERAIRDNDEYGRPIPLITTIRRFTDEGKIGKDAINRFTEAYNIRNRLVHTGDVITMEQARKTIDDLKIIWENIPK